MKIKKHLSNKYGTGYSVDEDFLIEKGNELFDNFSISKIIVNVKEAGDANYEITKDESGNISASEVKGGKCFIEDLRDVLKRHNIDIDRNSMIIKEFITNMTDD